VKEPIVNSVGPAKVRQKQNEKIAEEDRRILEDRRRRSKPYYTTALRMKLPERRLHRQHLSKNTRASAR
jgi:hypothetical protein